MSIITNTFKNVQQWQSEFSLYFVNKGNILNCAEEDPIKKIFVHSLANTWTIYVIVILSVNNFFIFLRSSIDIASLVAQAGTDQSRLLLQTHRALPTPGASYYTYKYNMYVVHNYIGNQWWPEGLIGKGIHINATEIMIYSPDVVGCLVEIIWASLAFNNVPVRQYNNDRSSRA